MKIILSVGIGILISLKTIAQIPINDAIELKALINPQSGVFEKENKAKVESIIKNYVEGSLEIPYEDNPFLKAFCSKLLVATEGAESVDGVIKTSTGKQINTGSIIIDGLARFIVDRIKKELEAAFFERLYTLIQRKEFQDCRTLFPNTYQTLKSIGDQIYNYEIYLTSLRNAFGKDLEIIIPNLENVIRNGQFAKYFTAHKEFRSICLTALFIANGIKKGEHIGTILENFPATSSDYIPVNNNEENFSIMHTVQFVQELSKSLKSKTGNPNRYWADEATLNELNDETTLKLYLGLLYERVKEIPFGTKADEKFGLLLKCASAKFDQLKQLVITTADNVRECETKLDSVKLNKNAENILNYINAISNLLNGIRNSQPFNELVSLAVNPLPKATQDKINLAWELLDKTNFVIDNATSLYAHLKDKKYSLAVSDVRNVYKECFPEDKVNKDERKKVNAIINFMIDYGSALAEMAEAKDSKEVYAAIDRIAAPVGSSRVKKETVFSMSLNAYGGGFIGKENIENLPDDKRVNNYGVSAPVGLAISLGRIKADHKNITNGFKSLTLFLSVIDIGAPVSFRFQNDKIDEIPSVSWKDIVSPGAFLIYGFGKVPVSLSAGYQVGPNLRKVTAELNEYENSRYGRFSVGLYVDIPVLMIARRKYW